METISKETFVSTLAPNGGEAFNVALTKGDPLQLTSLSIESFNGRNWMAANTSDGMRISINALLRKGNGLIYKSSDLKERAEDLYDAITRPGGLHIIIEKVFKSQTRNGDWQNNYRFEEAVVSKKEAE